MAASNQVFSAFSFITFLLVLTPLPWHLEAWNTGTIMFMFWTAVGLLINFINSVVWNNNAIVRYEVWCDISTKLLIGGSIGIPAAALCINRRLYMISNISSVTMTKRDKVKGIFVDLAIGVLIPAVVMALHHIVQGHRFDLFEDIGCFPTTYNVTLSYVFMQIPSLTIPLISAAYSILSIRAFSHRQAAFKEFLASNATGLSSSRYMRLICLAAVQVAIGLPLAIFNCVMNATVFGPVQPWVSWEVTHFGFWEVWDYEASTWRADKLTAGILEYNRWTYVLCGLLFFMFFGFAQEARTNYKKAIGTVCGWAGVQSPFSSAAGAGTLFGSKAPTLQGSSNFSKFKISTPGTGGNSSHNALPIYVEKEVINKRDSLDSFSDLMSVRSGGAESTMKPYTLPAGLSGPPGTTHSNTSTVVGAPSAPQSRSGSPTSARPRIEISAPHGVVPTAMRTPESAFPRAVTPSSFLEMGTPAHQESVLTTASTGVRRGDNWV